MKFHRSDSNTVWCIHSPRSGEYWYVKCPSRSGAKIFLCGSLGPQVPASKGPFQSWEYPEADVPAGQLLQAMFFPANDVRNWYSGVAAPEAESDTQGELQPTDAEAGSGDGDGDTSQR